MNDSYIETLWETHDFVLSNIVDKEDAVHFFVDNVDKKAALVEAEAITSDDFILFCEKALQDHEDLISLYCKHIHTLKDIVKIKPKNHPKEREVSLGSLNELINVTMTLKMALEESTLNLKGMISEVQEGDF